MTDERLVSREERCPSCSAQWQYLEDGKPYSYVMARVENDRVVEWMCPTCGESWARNAVVA